MSTPSSETSKGEIGVLTAVLVATFFILLVNLRMSVPPRYPPFPTFSENDFIPALRFDSLEKVYPHAFDFDNDWDPLNQSESYRRMDERPAPVVYYKFENYEDEGFEVHQFAYYYAYNPFINYHEHDLERAYVFVRDGKPKILALSAHIWWNLYQVENVSELTAEVERGGHAMWHEPIKDRVCEEKYNGISDRAGRVIEPSGFEARSWQELERDELYDYGRDMFGRLNLCLRTDERGDLRKAGEPGGEVPRLSIRGSWQEPRILLELSKDPTYWLGRVLES